MEPKETFGDNVRALRRQAGLTQMQLANAADMDMAEISRLELGKRDPRLSTMVRVADALGVPLDDCVAGIGRHAPE